MIPIKLEKEGAVTVALDVAQRGCKINLLDLKELRRLVMHYQDKLTKLNIGGKNWEDAELLITPRPPGYNIRSPEMQTAVWLKYHISDYSWYIHGIYRTKEPLPMPRVKIKDFSKETAYKAYRALIEEDGTIQVDGLTVFAIF